MLLYTLEKWVRYFHIVAGATKPRISKMLNVQESHKTWLLQHYNEWDSLLFTVPQWLYLFRLKSVIWTGQNLVS